MAERPLNPDEATLWRRVVETVQPLAGRVRPTVAASAPSGQSVRVEHRLGTPSNAAVPSRSSASAATSGAGLDGTWDRQLARGGVVPDRTIDLHGDTLAGAYGRIDAALAEASARGERLILLVTGKPGGERSGRGAIRAVVGDWLAASRHAGRIAAVRPAHPRHGGAGALYLILRKR